MVSEMKKKQLHEAHELEQAERKALLESAQNLQDKLTGLDFPSAEPSGMPCASFREAITVCYKKYGKDNPLACASAVEAYAECAKQLTSISD